MKSQKYCSVYSWVAVGKSTITKYQLDLNSIANDERKYKCICNNNSHENIEIRNKPGSAFYSLRHRKLDSLKIDIF